MGSSEGLSKNTSRANMDNLKKSPTATNPDKYSENGGSVFAFLDSALMSCRDGFCWSQPTDFTVISSEKIETPANVFDRFIGTCSSPVSVMQTQDDYASRWKGHLPLSPMPSTDPDSTKKMLLKRRRPVR